MTATNPQPKPIDLAKSAIEVPTIVEVTRERIAYTLCAALEGGSNYWCAAIRVGNYMEQEWAHEAIAASAPFTFSVFEEEDPMTPKLTLSAALKKLADEFPEHFNDMVRENEDAETGDVFFQLLCFGEIVYG